MFTFQNLDEYVGALLTLKQKIVDTEWVLYLLLLFLIIFYQFKNTLHIRPVPARKQKNSIKTF